jgi:hypothetical protein
MLTVICCVSVANPSLTTTVSTWLVAPSAASAS